MHLIQVCFCDQNKCRILFFDRWHCGVTRAILLSLARSPFLVISVTRFCCRTKTFLREPGMPAIDHTAKYFGGYSSPVTAYCIIKTAVFNAIDMW